MSSPKNPRLTHFLRVTLATVIVGACCAAQGTSIYDDQGNLIRAPKAVGTLGPDLFGDRSNLYSGSLEFIQNDVSVPGNNSLPVAVGRRFVAGSFTYGGAQFGNWDLEIPHLHGIFAGSWTTRWGTIRTNRCSSFGEPPTVTDSMRLTSHRGTDYWHGSFIYVPGEGDQEILSRNTANNNVPADGATYPLITTKLWAFSCLPTLKNGTGEGFVAVAPNGMRYQFDWIASRGTTSLETDEWQVYRNEVWIMPSKITDRFGNSVTYSYDAANPWQLNSITASDGRAISLTWGAGRIVSVTDGTRTWNYAYKSSTNELQTVTLPDNSRWDLGGITSLQQDINSYNDQNTCDSVLVADPQPATGSMTHPSGAIGTFTLTGTVHGRALVTYSCQWTGTYSTFLYYPKYFATYALTHKTISGPGISSPLAWHTTFPVAEPSLAGCTGYCPTTKTVEVTAPDGGITRYIFGTVFQTTEGQLQQTDVVQNGNVLRSTVFTYLTTPPPGTFAMAAGLSEQARGDGKLASELHPISQKVITQQGESFTWRGDNFDTRGRNYIATKYSSFGPSRTEQTTFDDKTVPWVVGLVGALTVNGKTPVSNSYDSLGSLMSTNHFGHLDEIFTYNADGTRATRRDGRNNQTDYLNYKRGIPQLVLYPEYYNGSRISESGVVNDIGLVTSVTDPVASTTVYGYDAIGRLSSIAYPADPGVTWNPTIISFTQSNSAIYGLTAGHWRQQINTGNAFTVNYFDALWRPVFSETWDAASPTTTKRFTQSNYDFAGHKVLESYPVREYAQLSQPAVGKRYFYDVLGRITQTSTDSELGTLNAYDTYGPGFMASHTNERGNTTNTWYQAFDEPAQDALTRIQLPNGDNINFGRDAFNKTTSIIRNGNDGKSVTRSYVYDSNERLCKTIEPETGATVQDYDLANNTSWRATGLSLPSGSCDTLNVPSQSKVSFTYDSLNRLTFTGYGDGSSSITRTYTPDSLPSTLGSNGSVWTNTYLNRRLPVRESLAYGGITYNIDRSYDANASLLSLIYPVDNLTINYAPNALGEPSQVGSYATQISYHPNGAVHSFTYGNGVTHMMEQNTRKLPWTLVESAGVLSDAYTYDENASVKGIADNQLGVATRNMTYDPLDRVAAVAAPGMWGNASYAYDGLDNLTSTTITGGATARTSTHTINPVTNRIDSISGGPASFNFTYSYDAQGNIVQRGSQAYVFDQGNRMASAPGKATYGYDGLGHRTSVVGTDGVNRIQVYSQGGQMLYAGPSGLIGTKYIYMHNHVLAEVGPGGVQYDHTDGLGSPVARTNAGQGVISRTRYEPYGYTAGGAVQGIGFTGHVNDADTGLVYMQQRYYDPVAGRFLSIDPVTTDANTGGGFNRYVYAANSPYRYIDPDGRTIKAIEKALEVVVKIKSTWNKAQIAAAEGKVAHLNQLGSEGKLVKTAPGGGPKPSTVYKGEKPKGSDLDHSHDKQLGGSTTDSANIAPLDSSVNRSLGSQIGSALRSSPYGTVVATVTLLYSEAASAASNMTAHDVGQAIIDASPIGDIQSAVEIKGLGGCGGSGKCSDEMYDPKTGK